jgi:hypothetical protein
MIEDYLTQIITKCYNHQDYERFEKLKCGLNEFTSLINSRIGNSHFTLKLQESPCF